MAVRTTDYKEPSRHKAGDLLDDLLDSSAPRALPQNGVTNRMTIGAVLLVFGVLQWLPAARFTVDGWTGWLNAVARWFGIADPIPRLSGIALLVAAVVIGWLYSRVEIGALPIQRVRGLWVRVTFMALIGWLFLTATDVGSTFAGLVAPPADAPRVWRDIAQTPELAGVLSFYLTFAPDWIILAGWKLLTRR